METKKVAIIGYSRIPFARINTAYADLDNQELLEAALNGLINKYHLQGKLLGEVAGGAVIKHISESNLIRESVMNTTLDPATPACDLQQACDTGIEAAVYIGNKIALGQIESGIACGVEAMSNIPFESAPRLRKALLKANKEKSVLGKLKQLLTPQLKDWMPIPYKGQEPKTGLVMGGHTEITAKYYQISREEQDQLALKSHQNMAKAYDEGFFDDMIIPAFGLDKDNNLRRDTSIEKLSQLKPAFDKENGTLTAGNSTPFTDGASAVLMGSEEWAKANGLPILAYVTFSEVAGIEYVENKHNLLLAPVFAADRMLRKAGMSLEDFDYYEIHEAFAAQVLATIKIWENDDLAKKIGLEKALGKIDRDKLNVKGGSLAVAHPFAATGGRIIGTLAKLLHEKGSGKGFISICAARGQGVTMILEK
ncbi:acetyl-CoA C-acetyltransferase [Chryseobacterium carnipullorum]|uniref:3-ketoacyl-CoA thiolase n=1 Tax=Chryseobacterium carnipullorum TaxID=1124835 RepID=A0A376EL51_CHRCU|nr:acetyl-CoA C-acetyltransferase [Chryseobacterium carnipullorum]AZA47598.1 acetyl-CoA C-acetyltransferase [Chryseobacterium carnipullorum]STD10785.1 3-ketoacyl-CoA thiolase [Chryseobacterium carnipullorum]